MTGIDAAMFELFREEARSHATVLEHGLIELEADLRNVARIEPLMRAAHSLKGAARIVGIDAAVRLAHVMEDALVAAQHSKIKLTPVDLDCFIQGADILGGLGQLSGPSAISDWSVANGAVITRLEPHFRALAEGRSPNPSKPSDDPTPPHTQIHSQTAGEVTPLTPTAVIESPPPFDFPTISDSSILASEDHSLFDLFREEIRHHLHRLVAIDWQVKDADPQISNAIDALNQIRGAALLWPCPTIAEWSLALNQLLHALSEGRIKLQHTLLDWINYGIAICAEVIFTSEDTFAIWVQQRASELARIASLLHTMTTASREKPDVDQSQRVQTPPQEQPPAVPMPPPAATAPPNKDELSPPIMSQNEAVVRVTAQSLNRLMGLAGESLVQARWLHHFSNELLQLKKRHDFLSLEVDAALHAIAAGSDRDSLIQQLNEIRQHAGQCRKELLDQSNQFDEHAARAEDLNSRLYREVIASRMRPFSDGLHGLTRLVRDMARTLGKQARLEIVGERTDVDRDILERLEAPLSHLIRNAVDHGLEPAEDRVRDGKPPVGTIRVHAWHRAGMLSISVADDGRGIDLARLRRRIVERGLNSAELVDQMTEAELLEFLFLPGFTTTTEVTEYSGRGVGLDVVQDTIRRIGGSVRISTRLGHGTTFHFQLPITLSVIRAVVVEIAGERYAFPHTRIDRLLRVPRGDVHSVEHRQYLTVDEMNVGLVFASQLLSLPAEDILAPELPIVLLSDPSGFYGLIVDAFRGEQDLVVRPLDPRLGKVADISAAAILDDGDPVLIIDVEDLLRSMDQFIQTGSLRRCETREHTPTRKKNILVVEDSITVREVERQLLLHRGYDVSVAVDGKDGWNQIRSNQFDLIVTDIDMPRMNGIQLVQAIRADDRLRNVPVVIVSYKERDEDRNRGLEVGANAYLTKSSFHDNRFVQIVEDLIGPA